MQVPRGRQAVPPLPAVTAVQDGHGGAHGQRAAAASAVGVSGV